MLERRSRVTKIDGHEDLCFHNGNNLKEVT